MKVYIYTVNSPYGEELEREVYLNQDTAEQTAYEVNRRNNGYHASVEEKEVIET